MATVMRDAANVVQEAIVPDSGHWIMEWGNRGTFTSFPTSAAGWKKANVLKFTQGFQDCVASSFGLLLVCHQVWNGLGNNIEEHQLIRADQALSFRRKRIHK
jgi:hypothetical protein